MLHLLRVVFLHAPHRKASDSAGKNPCLTAHRMADSNQFYIAKGSRQPAAIGRAVK